MYITHTHRAVSVCWESVRVVSSWLSSGMRRRRRRMDLTPAGIWCRDSKPMSSMISISQPLHPPFHPLLRVLWNVMCDTPCSFSSCHPPIYFRSSLLTSPAILFSLSPFLSLSSSLVPHFCLPSLVSRLFLLTFQTLNISQMTLILWTHLRHHLPIRYAWRRGSTFSDINFGHQVAFCCCIWFACPWLWVLPTVKYTDQGVVCWPCWLLPRPQGERGSCFWFGLFVNLFVC